ncbi:MAG: hypothetical protein KF708_21855 [Pirellulales bacterium]|nr:hypothetical protein [Pirellulales bacterium]
MSCSHEVAKVNGPSRINRTTFIFTVLVVLLSTNVARADLGQVRLSQTAGSYHVTVLTPAPLYQGTAVISVFVQDATTLTPIDDATVEVSARRQTDESNSGPTTIVSATRDQDIAGPHHVARPFLIEPGEWQIDVEITGATERQTVSFVCNVASTPPRWQTLWPWISWPPVVILLFALREYTRSRGRSPRQTTHSSP